VGVVGVVETDGTVVQPTKYMPKKQASKDFTPTNFGFLGTVVNTASAVAL
jgi:hypothetical protein